MKLQIFRNLWVLQIAFLLLAPLGLQAQKKEISAAKDLVKAGKDLAKAESSMRKLLTDSANRNNKKIWNILFDAVKSMNRVMRNSTSNRRMIQPNSSMQPDSSSL